MGNLGFFDPTPDVNFAHVCSHQPTRAWFYLKLALTPTMRELTIGWHYFRNSTVVFINLRRDVGRSKDLRGRTPLLPPCFKHPSHYVDWDFNSKNASHFQFMQKPFIFMQATEKKIKKFLCGTSEIFAFIHFGSHGRAQINLKFFGGDIILTF